eukprot:468435_1
MSTTLYTNSTKLNKLPVVQVKKLMDLEKVSVDIFCQQIKSNGWCGLIFPKHDLHLFDKNARLSVSSTPACFFKSCQKWKDTFTYNHKQIGYVKANKYYEKFTILTGKFSDNTHQIQPIEFKHNHYNKFDILMKQLTNIIFERFFADHINHKHSLSLFQSNIFNKKRIIAYCRKYYEQISDKFVSTDIIQLLFLFYDDTFDKNYDYGLIEVYNRSQVFSPSNQMLDAPNTFCTLSVTNDVNININFFDSITKRKTEYNNCSAVFWLGPAAYNINNELPKFKYSIHDYSICNYRVVTANNDNYDKLLFDGNLLKQQNE